MEAGRGSCSLVVVACYEGQGLQSRAEHGCAFRGELPFVPQKNPMASITIKVLVSNVIRLLVLLKRFK